MRQLRCVYVSSSSDQRVSWGVSRQVASLFVCFNRSRFAQVRSCSRSDSAQCSFNKALSTLRLFDMNESVHFLVLHLQYVKLSPQQGLIKQVLLHNVAL